MKGMLLAVFSAMYFGAFAQITVTSATFPNAGDTLRFATSTDVSGNASALTPSGASQLWDFSDLQADSESETVFVAASSALNSMEFPTADLAVIGGQGESFFHKTNNLVEFLGYAGGDPANLGVQVAAHYSPALVERRAPLNFFDVNTQNSALTLPFSTENLPDTLFTGAPFVPDSIRVRISTERLDIVDGWGTCFIPGGEYDVLRLKRSEYTNTAVDILVPVLGWVDLSSLVPNGGGFGAFLGTDTTNTYRFYSGTEKEEIAVVTANADWTVAESIRYKNNGTSPSITVGAPGRASISAFPNPAVEWVRFDCTNLPSSDYTLKIFNIVGKVVWKKTYPLSGNKSIKVELEDFKKGTYLYSLADKNGKVVGTKRLVVLKP